MTVDLLPGAEQLEIVTAAGEFLADRMPVERIRANRHAQAPVPESLWRECGELGLLTLGLDEESGGAGRPFDDEALLFVELGKRLAPGPFLACTLGARVAARCGDDALAQRIGSGTASVALAVLRGDGDVRHARPVKGTFDLFEPAGASHALVVARSGAALVDIDSFGQLVPVHAADPGTRISSATVESAEPLHWLPAEDEWIWARAMVLASAYLTGLAAAAAALATEHAKTRVQFGKPIGVHQAIKHACVNMEIAAEAAQAQTFFAAIALADGRADALLQVLSAVTVAGSAAVDNAAAGIHVFGGMGYTFENDMHLYLKRAHVFRHLFGEPTEVLAELLAQDRAQ
ncbi:MULTISPECIES: acyl-CoA dehydrogenase family protein [Mycobacterium avium complex (MAC)]|uniref:Acyl-CoA/acyl-ACP dehydrogenase n=4 Tax=Mycobacterium avium complex (MAC) TaxID=120793 RepID=A0AAW5S518_MYCBC|nr:MULTISPECIES: acyl-CoA dehydrogenase family protein [Mycobacterium avium complex (MAC)]ETB18181.1 acyl-CoA dehydrogenase [Mycobacterium avium 09-5983]MCV6990080.1 acyl-CoA/acyl-ACP dehydrogenase [Mycobacterium bouchedurhonense]MCV6997118.1 acyl-CoA/acyl-ACP dehydrogenase [Mycobacterium timonense]MDV3218697.1 acyl-CoA/acyl-ACP dehydrogenase [Mycobacterium avium]MDV3247758.1 acyl-CoA/acyl-ACP dehydrogenase [Mycobacterium avium subsp. hominissuis]